MRNQEVNNRDEKKMHKQHKLLKNSGNKVCFFYEILHFQHFVFEMWNHRITTLGSTVLELFLWGYFIGIQMVMWHRFWLSVNQTKLWKGKCKHRKVFNSYWERTTWRMAHRRDRRKYEIIEFMNTNSYCDGHYTKATYSLPLEKGERMNICL